MSRPSISNAIILHRIKHKFITSLTWSPQGDILVSAASEDMEILVWNVELDRTSSLKRPGYSGNVLVKFSPSGEKLFTASTGLVFRYCYTKLKIRRFYPIFIGYLIVKTGIRSVGQYSQDEYKQLVGHIHQIF